jgi:hypothetical protein
MMAHRLPLLILVFASLFVPVAISQTGLVPQSSGTSVKTSGGPGGKLLSDPQGLDWNEYLRHVSRPHSGQ